MVTRRRVIKILVALAIVVAAFLVYRSLGRYSVEEIRLSVASIPQQRLLFAFAFVVGSYTCLSGFDWLAVRYAGHALPYRQVALASFCSLSIGHNVGMAALSSGAVRYRFYSRWGLSGEQVAKVIIFCGVTVGLGLVTLAGLALTITQGRGGDLLGINEVTAVTLGCICLLVPTLYLLICWRVERPLILYRWSFQPPSVWLALGQIAVGTLNFACVAACIHQLLLGISAVNYLTVATAYVTANIAALISHVPGGLGVLEATILGVLPIDASIGALVVFRILYFFVPLMVGVPTLVASEAYFRRQPRRRISKQPAG
nr:lysylphosphatidylglycerol synthetase family protein [Rhizobium sp. Khangiran2]